MSHFQAFTACVIVLATSALACGPKPAQDANGHGVLVIVVDALRADHVGVLGYDRDTLPNLALLAKEGAVFESVYACAPETLPAHAGLLSGCDALFARRPRSIAAGPASTLSTWLLPDGVPSLAQEFLAAGYETAAFVDHPSISAIRGFAKGFQTFSGFREDALSPELEYGFEGVGTRFFRWLGERDPGRDWFAYLELNDLERLWTRADHDPKRDTFYEPRAELSAVPPVGEAERLFFAVPRSRWPGGSLSVGEYEARYDGALRQLDGKLGRLIDRLRRSGRLATTTLVVVGSHGLSLGESGLYLDSGTLSDVDLRVPLVIRPAPTSAHAVGLRSAQLASTIDVAPTLLDLAGLRVPRAMQGVSLAPLVRGNAIEERAYVFAAGGLNDGIAAIGKGACWERSSPGGGDALVAASWYGDDDPKERAPREHLHVHARDASEEASASPALAAAARRARSGHSSSGDDDRALALELARAADEWYAWIVRARAVLQAPPSARSKADPALLRELRARGFLEAAE